MRTFAVFRILIVFAIAISLSSLPAIHSVVAVAAPASVWYPAGPAMNVLLFQQYASAATEFNPGLLTGQIDLMDVPVLVPPCNVPATTYLYYDAGTSFCWSGYYQNVVNAPAGGGFGPGTPNPFDWLNAYSNGVCQSNGGGCAPLPAPLVNEIRQGFSTAVTNLNPYTAPLSPVQNQYILHEIYDSLVVPNAFSNAQLIDWLTTSSQQLTTVPSYAPPGTAVTLRFDLRNNIFFHNGARMTTYDVAYSLASLWNSVPVAPQASGLSNLLAITILSPFTLDMHLSAPTPYGTLTSNTIMPGDLWTNNPAAYTARNACVSGAPPPGCFPATYQVNSGVGCYLGTFVAPNNPPCPIVPGTAMVVNPALAAGDPLAQGNFIGSGPWLCEAFPGSLATLGGGCSSNGVTSPATAFYSLTRYDPSTAGTSHDYFRSSAKLATDIWTGDIGISSVDFLTLSTVASCIGKPVNTAGCIEWQNGIGSATPGIPSPVIAGEWVEVAQYIGIPWMPVPETSGAGYNWGSLNPGGSALAGLGTAPSGYSPTTTYPYQGAGGPTLYAGGTTYLPCQLAPVTGYDC